MSTTGDLPIGRDPDCRICKGRGEVRVTPSDEHYPAAIEYEPCFCVLWESAPPEPEGSTS